MRRSALHDDGIGGKGLSVHSFAECFKLRVSHVERLCRDGKIFGARKHPLTK